jgi:hypothetical protein
MMATAPRCPLCDGYGYVYDWRLVGPQVCQGCDGTGILNGNSDDGDTA